MKLSQYARQQGISYRTALHYKTERIAVELRGEEAADDATR